MIWAIKDSERIKALPGITKATCPLCSQEVIAKCGVIKIWHWAHKNLEDCDGWAEPETQWHINWKDEFPKDWQEVKIENHRADVKTKYDLVIEFQNSSISSDNICDREQFYNNMIWVINGETLAKNIELRNQISYFSFRWKTPPQSWFNADKEIYIDMGNKVKENDYLLDDSFERVGLLYNELKKLIKTEPNEFDFGEYEYGNFGYDLKKKKIKEVYNNWSEVSREIDRLKKTQKMYNGKTIFLIKKLYKNIPCGGWGILISKEQFLKELKGENGVSS